MVLHALFTTTRRCSLYALMSSFVRTRPVFSPSVWQRKCGRGRQLDIFCSWCFANKDKKFQHDVKDCFSKRKSVAANNTEARRGAAKKCEMCDETDHTTRGCPFGPSVKQHVQEAKAAEAKAKVPTTSTDASTGDDKVCI
jgi:hypothetical protein